MDTFGKVVSVEMNATITKQNGGTYQGARLAYRDGNGKMTEQNFTSQTLKYNPSITTALGNLNPNDNFKMVKEKEGEFWNVKSITLAGAQTVEDAPANNARATPVAKATGGSTYASAEERANVQIYIVRQSNITAAINTLTPGAKGALMAKDVLTVAKIYENYVFGKGADLDIDGNTSDINFDDEVTEEDYPL